jgi:hypothetical protein
MILDAFFVDERKPVTMTFVNFFASFVAGMVQMMRFAVLFGLKWWTHSEL